MKSWNEIRKAATAFSKRWKDAYDEKSQAQSFLKEFFAVFGVDAVTVATFEHRVKFSDGSQGYADCFWQGKILVEMKSRGKDLDAAFQQALDYVRALPDASQTPRAIVVSDFARVRFYDLSRDCALAEFALKDLRKYVTLFGYMIGAEENGEIREQDPVNRKAAEKMAKLHDAMKAVGYAGHPLEVYLVRLLFCLFAEDTGIFKPNQFCDFIEQRTSTDGSDLAAKLAELFQVLNTPPANRLATRDESLAAFPYVNGGLFAEFLPIAAFSPEMRRAILDCGELDWSKISPAIFGAMFQGVMDKDARHDLGAHYTSEENILKLIRPLFLDGLRSEFDDICALKGTSRPSRLKAFHEKISSLTFLDPACGCGNFLLIGYRELRHMEMDVLDELHKDDPALVLDVTQLCKVNVSQFYGIEIEPFPAEIAKVALWLMDHLCNMEVADRFGQYFARIPIKDAPHIVCANALTTDWGGLISRRDAEAQRSFDYIMGNPPFLGFTYMSPEQKADMLSLFPKNKNLDFVCGWYKKASDLIQGTGTRCAFVSTNSITQGETAAFFWPTVNFEIDFAYRTFKWHNEAKGVAAVHCVIIGFSTCGNGKKHIFDGNTAIPAENINSYLINAPNVIAESRNRPLCDVPQMIYGNKPTDGGNLIFTPEEKDAFLAAEPQAEPLIRPLLGAEEFINGKMRYCLWLVDVDPALLRKCPKVLERTEAVRQFRLASKAEATRNYAPMGGLFRQITQPEGKDYIAIPRLSSERRNYVPIGFLTAETKVTDLIQIIPDAKLYHFAILISHMHMAWMRAVAGRLKSDYRYSKDIVYNNFIWPDLCDSAPLREKIAEAAQAVLDARAAHSGATLADLYDPLTMPPDLVKAHAHLDPHSVSADYFDGVAVKIGDLDPFSYPEGSTNTVLEHIFYSGTTNGVIVYPQSSIDTAVLEISVSGTGTGRLVVGDAVVPLVAPPQMRSGVITNTLLLEVGRGVRKEVWFTKPDGLDVELRSDDLLIGRMPTLYWPHGWLAFPHTEATVPCIHDFYSKGRVVSLVHGEEFPGLAATWSSEAQGVAIKNVPPVSAEIHGSFPKSQVRSISYTISHPDYICGVTNFAQTLRFCPQFANEPEPDLGEGGSAGDDGSPEYWSCDCSLSGACNCCSGEWCHCYCWDCPCNANQSPTLGGDDDEAEESFTNIVGGTMTPLAHVLYLYRANTNLEHLVVPSGSRSRCCPCPDHWQTNYVAKAFCSRRLAVNYAADGEEFRLSHDPCDVTISGVSPSRLFADSSVLFVTNGATYAKHDCTVLGVAFESEGGRPDISEYNRRSPSFGYPAAVCTNLGTAASIAFVSDVLLGEGFVRVSMEDVSGDIALWLPEWWDSHGTWHPAEPLLQSGGARARHLTLRRWRSLIGRYCDSRRLHVRIVSPRPSRCKVRFEFASSNGAACVYDHAEQRISTVKPPLLADYDWNFSANVNDALEQGNGRILYFWTNHDTWRGDDAFSQYSEGMHLHPTTLPDNGDDLVVNGRNDLVNLCPLAVDLSRFVSEWGTSEVRYVFYTGSPGNIRFVPVRTEWGKLDGIVKEEQKTVFDDDLHSSALAATSREGYQEVGYELPPELLALGSSGAGVIAAEFATEGWHTLRIAIKDAENGFVLFDSPVSVRALDVHRMYRWLNLDYVCNATTDPKYSDRLAVDWPDTEHADANVVFVHGYNMHPSEAWDWSQAMFKRLRWSGMDAGFTAVLWRGNESQAWVPKVPFVTEDNGYATRNYHQNVLNAFRTGFPPSPLLPERTQCRSGAQGDEILTWPRSVSLRDSWVILMMVKMTNKKSPTGFTVISYVSHFLERKVYLKGW